MEADDWDFRGGDAGIGLDTIVRYLLAFWLRCLSVCGKQSDRQFGNEFEFECFFTALSFRVLRTFNKENDLTMMF